MSNNHLEGPLSERASSELWDDDQSERITLGQAIGEVTWLASQSNLHREMKVKELAWLIHNPITRKQFHLFRSGKMVIGAAIWAFTDAAGDQALENGTFDAIHCNEAAWSSGDTLWLVDLIAPFNNPENHQQDLMLADLITGPFSGRAFKTMVLSSKTLSTNAVHIDAEAGRRMVEALRASVIQ